MFKVVGLVELHDITNPAYDYLKSIFEKELNDLSEYDDGSTDIKLEIGKIKFDDVIYKNLFSDLLIPDGYGMVDTEPLFGEIEDNKDNLYITLDGDNLVVEFTNGFVPMFD